MILAENFSYPSRVFNAPAEGIRCVPDGLKNQNDRVTRPKKSLMISLAVSIQYRSVTDRWTTASTH